jgi:hypothetical protein
MGYEKEGLFPDFVRQKRIIASIETQRVQVDQFKNWIEIVGRNDRYRGHATLPGNESEVIVNKFTKHDKCFLTQDKAAPGAGVRFGV